jgi:hypothetical protein
MENKNTILKNYYSGYISGVCAILVSHPIDTIKTNYQEGLRIKFNLFELYRGLSAPLIGIGIEKAIVFGTYNTIYDKYNNHAFAGAFAGLSASFIVTPYERIKILKQTNKEIKLKSITPKYLFQGLSATFYREVPGFAIYFTTYNYLKDKSIHYFNKPISTLESFIYGGFSGAWSWVFIYPQDRIKTHIQSSTNKMSFIKGFSDLIKNNNIKGLYKGFHFALLRAIPLHATAFMVNELFHKYI